MSKFDMSRFPEVDPGVQVAGVNVLVQLAQPKKSITKSGIILPEAVKDTNQFLMTLGRVVSMGEAVGKNQDGTPRYGVGSPFKIGDFVEVPKTHGLTFTRKAPDGSDVQFTYVTDDNIIGKRTDDITDVIG